MFEGAMMHKDNHGRECIVSKDGVQYMVAGKGIIHSESAVGESENCGVQFWINLKQDQRMIKSSYSLIDPSKIKVKNLEENVKLKVVIGHSKMYQMKSQIETVTPFTILDIEIKNSKGYLFRELIPKNNQLLIYIVKGNCIINNCESEKKLYCNEKMSISFNVNNNCDSLLEIESNDENILRFLILFGIPISEPFVRVGPFILNSKEEISQAFKDFQSGHNFKNE
jgi:redox-sensitive bicupin YhaK (pirin superfamily)